MADWKSCFYRDWLSFSTLLTRHRGTVAILQGVRNLVFSPAEPDHRLWTVCRSQKGTATGLFHKVHVLVDGRHRSPSALGSAIWHLLIVDSFVDPPFPLCQTRRFPWTGKLRLGHLATHSPDFDEGLQYCLLTRTD